MPLACACLLVVALLATACATQTTGVAVSDGALEAMTPPTLPSLGDASEQADLVDATPEAETADGSVTEPEPWSALELLAGLEGAGALPLAELLPLALADIEAFWEREVAELWDLDFYPVSVTVEYDSQTVAWDELPECLAGLDREVLVNASYCLLEDTIAWDIGVLFPYLDESFGSLAAASVLAHEYGHAIQGRLGTWLDPVAWRADVILELQADCYEGAWIGDLVSRGGGELGINRADVEATLRSKADLADVPGWRATDFSAHGTVFDRMSAFRQGLIEGAGTCVGYVEALPIITSAAFSEAELENLGNLPVGEVLPVVVGDLRTYWDTAFENFFGSTYETPAFVPIAPGSGSVTPCAGIESDPAAMAGLATYCTAENHVVVDVETLLPSLEPVGDFAAVYPVVHAWSLSVLMQGLEELPPGGAVLAADCVSGSWVRQVWEGRGDLDLSAGDIDEAILGTQHYSPTGPDGAALPVVPGLLDRVGAFGRGFASGFETCLS